MIHLYIAVERFSSANIQPDDDSHYNAASALLMSMNNASYQSVNGQRYSRTVDVTDLRDALGGSLSPPCSHPLSFYHCNKAVLIRFCEYT